MTEELFTTLELNTSIIVYSILVIFVTLLIVYSIAARVLISHAKKCKEVMTVSQSLLNDISILNVEVDNLKEFREIVRVIRNIYKAEGGLFYLHTLSKHCRDEILIMKSIKSNESFGKEVLDRLLGELVKDLNRKIGIVEEIKRLEGEDSVLY